MLFIYGQKKQKGMSDRHTDEVFLYFLKSRYF